MNWIIYFRLLHKFFALEGLNPKEISTVRRMRFFLENILHNLGDYVIDSIDLAQRLGDYAHRVKHFNCGNLSPISFSLISFFIICKKDWESMPT